MAACQANLSRRAERELSSLVTPSHFDNPTKIDITASSLTRCFSGATNPQLDLQNPSNINGQPATDIGLVPNLKWSFSLSKTRMFHGGWIREQVISDLPASHDIAGAQVHLTKGGIRQMHWHRVVCFNICLLELIRSGNILLRYNFDHRLNGATFMLAPFWYLLSPRMANIRLTNSPLVTYITSPRELLTLSKVSLIDSHCHGSMGCI